jgi:hypothetical protein
MVERRCVLEKGIDDEKCPMGNRVCIGLLRCLHWTEK